MCIYEKWTKFLDPFNIVSTNLNSIPHYFYVNQFNLKHSFEKIEKRSENFNFSDHCFPKVWVKSFSDCETEIMDPDICACMILFIYVGIYIIFHTFLFTARFNG